MKTDQVVVQGDGERLVGLGLIAKLEKRILLKIVKDTIEFVPIIVLPCIHCVFV